MKCSTILATASGLASTAVAVAVPRAALSGTQEGSLFSFDPAPSARTVFYTKGSCGLSTYFVGVVPDDVALVAMPISVMQNYGASQSNTLCGKIITMTSAKGVTQKAAIADTNMGPDDSIDMTMDLWLGFGQPGSDASVMKSLSWSIDGAGSGGGVVGGGGPIVERPSVITSSTNGNSGDCKQTYTVVSGDYCYLLWTKYGITETQLRSWNPSLDSNCLLQVGQELCVSQ